MRSCEPNRKKMESFLKGRDIEKDIEVFKLLSNPIRLRIALLLAEGEELCTCDLEKILECEQTLISHHMRPFKELDLVTDRRDGKWKHYSLKNKRVKKILEVMR